MQNIQEQVSKEYLQKIQERLDSTGRLFLVDGLKARAFQAVKSAILPKSTAFGAGEDTSSVICIVQDETVADEIQEAFSNEFRVIRSVDDFIDMLDGIGLAKSQITDTSLNKFAPAFKRNYGKIIIPAINSKTKEPILNAELFKDSSMLQAFVPEQDSQNPYQIADFLCKCGYELVVIDNIYEMISFSEEKNDNKSYLERIDFLAEAYYPTTECSYTKLKKIVDLSKRCVMISDIVIDKNAVSLYLALDMLYDSFSLSSAKEFVLSYTRAYEDDCLTTCDYLIDSCEDSSVLSACMMKNKNKAQVVPRDATALKKNLSDRMALMTKEEAFLKAIYYQARNRFDFKCVSIESVYESLENRSDAAQCICDVFYNDTIKAELESVISHAHVCDMTSEEFSAIISVFNKYGVCVELDSAGNKCKLVRIYRDTSAFENAIRAVSEDFDKHGEAYSITRDADMLEYKCAVVSDMILSGRISAPLVVVVNERKQETIDTLFRLLNGQYGCKGDLSSLCESGDSKSQIAVIGYDELRRTTRFLNTRYAVFFDMASDINIFDMLLKKAVAMGDTTAIIIADYCGISGHMLDAWAQTLLTSRVAVPFRSSEIFIKGQTPSDYPVVVSEIEHLYTSLRDVCEGKYNGEMTKLVGEFHKFALEYTLTVFESAENIERDLRYFSKIATEYNAIFSNSVSIGARGESVVFKHYLSEKVEKKPKKFVVETRIENGEQKNALVFNVCSKQLLRECDFKAKNCATCSEYKECMVNDIDAFFASVGKFFIETEKMANELELERLKRKEKIKGDGERRDMVSLDQVKANFNFAREKILSLMSLKEGLEGPIYVPYSTVEEIRRMVGEIYNGVFIKYYEFLKGILDLATDKMKKAFVAISQSNAK